MNGCFTREAPFYEESQIEQIPNLGGQYRTLGEAGAEHDDGTSWSIFSSTDFPGKYEVVVRESEATVRLLAVVFRVETNLFVDLYPLRDSGVHHEPSVASVTEIIRAAMWKPMHVVWKIEISDGAVNYAYPLGNGVMAALQKDPELKGEPAESPMRILVPGTEKEAQKHLLRFKDDNSVFSFRGRLVKKEAQPNGAANRGQPTGPEKSVTPHPAGPGR